MAIRKQGQRVADHEAARDRVLEALRLGNTRSAAAAYAGIHSTMLQRWKKADEEFAQECLEAETEAEMAHVANIKLVAIEQKLWTASAWWLERRRPRSWGKVTEIDLTKLTKEQLLQLQGEIEAREPAAQSDADRDDPEPEPLPE